MKILKYKQFNELRIEELDPANLETIKYNLFNHLKEYRTYFLENIYIENDIIKYKNFTHVDIDSILSQLNTEFTKEFVDQLNMKTFLRKINFIMDSKHKNIKKEIRDAFNEYQNILTRLINNEFNF